MNKIIAVTLMLIMPYFAFASADSGYAGSFLFDGDSGARNAGLSGANVSDIDDASGGYYNPALIAPLKFTQFTFYYLSPYEDIGFSAASFAIPLNEYGILGFQRIELSVDGIERITSDGIKTGDFKDVRESYLLSYAYQFENMISAGISGRFVSRVFDSFSANGFGLDAGLAYKHQGLFSVSMAFLNVMQPSLKLGSSFETYPLNMRFGTAVYLLDSNLVLTGGVLVINLLSDGRDFLDEKGRQSIRFASGAEYRAFGFTAIRAGISRDAFTAGAGLTAGNFTLDYAMEFKGTALMHNFGITALFGEVPTERERRLKAEKTLLEKGMEEMTGSQLYLAAMNDYNSGMYEEAEKRLKKLEQSGKLNAEAQKLRADIKLAFNRREAGKTFDSAAKIILDGKREQGLKMITEAEKTYKGITDAKIKEYFEAGSKAIDSRNYQEASDKYKMILAVEPGNAKAAEMLDKLEGLREMLKK